METSKIIKTVRKSYKLQQVISEWKWFLDNVQDAKPKLTIEIGFGGGASALCLSYPTEELISLEKRKIKRSQIFQDIEENCKYRFMRVDSPTQEAKRAVEKILDGREIDVLFIDGNHTYKYAKRDFENYAPMVKNGGIIGLQI